MKRMISTTFLFLSINLALTISSSWAKEYRKECSSSACGPIISKCQLINACRCDAQLNYACHQACTNCLGDYFAECCSCVDICPDHNDKGPITHVKVINQTNPELFEVLVADEDLRGRWVVHQEPILAENHTDPLNCTMAFISQCTEHHSCESSCTALGASGYRWFQVDDFDKKGCCECVGHLCSNFGVNQIRCRNCPTVEYVYDSVDSSSSSDISRDL